MAIEIEITADLNDAIRAFQKGEISLEDLGEAAKNAGEDGRDAGKDIGKGGDDIAEGLDKATESSGKLGDSFGNVGGIAKDALEGNVGGAVEKVGTAVGALAGAIPGIGAAVGVLATEGIGALVSGLQDSQKEADALKEKISSAYRSAIEEGRTFLDEAQIQAAAFDIIYGAGDELKNAQRDAAAIGVSSSDYIRALAGDQAALNEVIAAGVQKQAELNEETRGAVGANGELVSAYDSRLTLVSDINDRLATQKQITEDTIANANLALQVTGEDLIQIQKRNDELARTPRSIPVSIVPDTSALDNLKNTRYFVNVTAQINDRYGRTIV